MSDARDMMYFGVARFDCLDVTSMELLEMHTTVLRTATAVILLGASFAIGDRIAEQTPHQMAFISLSDVDL